MNIIDEVMTASEAAQRWGLLRLLSARPVQAMPNPLLDSPRRKPGNPAQHGS